MPLNSLIGILKNNFLNYFIYPLTFIVLALSVVNVIYNIKKLDFDDFTYVQTLRKPFVNSILLYQTQESQLLLNSISDYRKWKEAYLVDANNIITQTYPYLDSFKVGKILNSKCSNEIVLNQKNKFVSKLCYKRYSWSFLDISLSLFILGTFITFYFMFYFYKNSVSKVSYFFERLSSAIDRLENENSENVNPEFLEEAKIIDALNKKLELVKHIKEKEVESIESLARLELAEQVSHDIRSPLEALRSISTEIKIIPENELLIFNNSLQRINDIANSLLYSKNQVPVEKVEHSLISLHDFIILINNLILEKNTKTSYSDISLRFSTTIIQNFTIKINKSELTRVISNVINNAIEAMMSKGNIIISLDESEFQIILSISDNGKGIPEKILNQIGKRGFSYGKELSAKSGTGLGVFYSKNIIESAGGKVEINSKENVGTEFIIKIPKLNLSEIFYSYVYIDNDELCRLVWNSTAQKKGINLLVLDNISEFFTYSHQIDKDFTKIYIDSDLGEKNIKGEAFAEELYKKGFKNLYIATGHPPENFKNLTWLKYSTKKCPF